MSSDYFSEQKSTGTIFLSGKRESAEISHIYMVIFYLLHTLLDKDKSIREAGKKCDP
jgi:hypothetical protein